MARIKVLAREYQREFDPDHFGVGLTFRLGGWAEPVVEDYANDHHKRTGRDPRHSFAIGDAQTIMQRIEEYEAAGIAKFVLRPLARGDDETLEQTRLLVAELLPAIAKINAARKGGASP